MPYFPNYDPPLNWVIGREVFAPVEAFAASDPTTPYEFAAAEHHVARASIAVRILLGLPASNPDQSMDEHIDECLKVLDTWDSIPEFVFESARDALKRFVHVAKGGELTHRFSYSMFNLEGNLYSVAGRDILSLNSDGVDTHAAAYTNLLRALVREVEAVFCAVYKVTVHQVNVPCWEESALDDECEFEPDDGPTEGQVRLVLAGVATSHAEAHTILKALCGDGEWADGAALERAADIVVRIAQERHDDFLECAHADFWREGRDRARLHHAPPPAPAQGESVAN